MLSVFQRLFLLAVLLSHVILYSNAVPVTAEFSISHSLIPRQESSEFNFRARSDLYRHQRRDDGTPAQVVKAYYDNISTRDHHSLWTTLTMIHPDGYSDAMALLNRAGELNNLFLAARRNTDYDETWTNTFQEAAEYYAKAARQKLGMS